LKINRNIPNFLTCCNLLCGCLAIVCAFEGNLVWSAYLVGIAAVFDFFDGFVARLLGVSSPIGKDLDSLADMVTFGVVPGIVMYKFLYLISETSVETISSGWHATIVKINYTAFVALIIPVFSAIRLAKFNNDTRQSESFIGLPTPANAIFFCSIILIYDNVLCMYSKNCTILESRELVAQDFIGGFLSKTWLIITLIILFSFLLLAELPLFALKFKSFGWKGNEIRYIFLGLSLILMVTLQFIGIPLVIVLYILLSVVHNLVRKRNIPSL
jgi:CDP-diacylglycerol---serine O-phosphatidyltransferase